MTLELVSLNEVRHRLTLGITCLPLDASLLDGGAHERTLALGEGEGAPLVTIQLQWHSADSALLFRGLGCVVHSAVLRTCE